MRAACSIISGIERADVMGYSMGARIAAFLALAHPARVRSVVFGGLGVNMVRGVAGTGPIAQALEAASIDEVTNPTRAPSAPSPSRPAAISRRWPPASARRARRSRAEALGTLRCPVLVVVGERDVIGGSARSWPR